MVDFTRQIHFYKAINVIILHFYKAIINYILHFYKAINYRNCDFHEVFIEINIKNSNFSRENRKNY